MTNKLDITKLTELKTTLDTELKIFLENLKDKTIPLDERWEVYSTLVNTGILNNIETYGDGFIKILDENLTLYDNFCIERHETHDFISFYEYIEDQNQEILAEWQETVLASGYSGFTYDW